MDLYKYKELLEVINIIVIFSIPMVSVIFYTLNKDTNLLIESIIYILEFFMYILLINPNKTINIIILGIIF
ncbi:hypothetical protein, partial [Romboutsia sp. 13368]|uniref:hypothetical protein n=1 Tax=Romboutsia sp. 13368 TaxID=2708053 RepID=UPI0025E9A300